MRERQTGKGQGKTIGKKGKTGRERRLKKKGGKSEPGRKERKLYRDVEEKE